MWILFRHKVKEARASASPPPAASVLLPLQPPPLPSLQSYCQSPHPGVPALRAQKESLHNARHHLTIISDQASAELVAKETAIERVPVVEEEAKAFPENFQHLVLLAKVDQGGKEPEYRAFPQTYTR